MAILTEQITEASSRGRFFPDISHDDAHLDNSGLHTGALTQINRFVPTPVL